MRSRTSWPAPALRSAAGRRGSAMPLKSSTIAATIALAAALAVFGPPAIAHHAFSAEFDATRPVTLRGTVSRVEWVNPHAWIHISVVTRGKTDEWMIEGGTPNALFRRGIT